ncbi:MAG: PIN domain-containing protein [Theionarchaea archaeon]|nr:PIN domain-containing protein [Theionarchaea archaeon]
MERDKERIRIVIDSNIIFSFIIKGKNSAYLDIFSNDNLEAYAPEAIIHEFRKHRERLKGKSEAFAEGVFLAFSIIRIMPREFYLDSFEKAYNICRRFDEKDSPFIGLALTLNIPIWTNDKGILENKGEYQIITINELRALLDE